jgi:transposase
MGTIAADWRRLDERIETVSAQIEALAEQDESCQRLMTVPGIGPIISSAVVAAIGNGSGFTQGRDFGAWLGLVPRQESTGDRPSPVVRSCNSPKARQALLPEPERHIEPLGNRYRLWLEVALRFEKLFDNHWREVLASLAGGERAQ